MEHPNTAGRQEPLIQAQHLKKYFKINKKKTLHAVDDVSFEIYPGETLGLVGESGCGKSTVGNVIMRLLPRTDGKLLYRGKDIFEASKEESMELCKKMQIIFQDPYSSLNPRKTIRKILSESYEIHHYGSKETIAKTVEELCDRVQVPQNLLDRFPHELDGGMRQIVGIAGATRTSRTRAPGIAARWRASGLRSVARRRISGASGRTHSATSPESRSASKR